MVGFYAGSDGSFYTEWEVGQRMESGVWEPCMWNTETGWELVESDAGLVWLVPVEASDLPPWVEVRETVDGPGEEAVDTRG